VSRLFGPYEWQFTKRAEFTQGLEYLRSFEDNSIWKFNSETALIVAITDVFALKVSYPVLYNHDPRPSVATVTRTSERTPGCKR
jgi:putative salt-induced outer membrane protein YdiY